MPAPEGYDQLLPGDVLHRPDSAAKVMHHKSKKTLERWRLTGEGPPYIRIGKTPLYPEKWLFAFMAKRAFMSTAAESSAAPQRKTITP